jgi:hypothetical protein
MISTGTLGENKANVKLDFSFSLLSPHASSGAKPSRDIPKKELLARRALDHDPGKFGILASIHPGRNPPVRPCVFSSKTHRRGMVSSASTRVPV